MDDQVVTSGTYDYVGWNAKVNEVLKDTCPELQVEYYTELGGGCQAVIVGTPNMCVGITDDCLCVYPVGTKELWSEDLDYEPIYVDHSEHTSVSAAACAVALLLHFSVNLDAEYLAELALGEEWGEQAWEDAIAYYPCIWTWHKNSSDSYYIKSLLRKAFASEAPITAVYFDGEIWHVLEDAVDVTAKNMLGRMYHLWEVRNNAA